MNYLEYVDLFKTVRSINEGLKPDDQIEIWGYDIQAPQAAASKAKDYLVSSGIVLPAVLDDGLGRLSNTGNSIFAIKASDAPSFKNTAELLCEIFLSSRQSLVSHSSEKEFFFHQRLANTVLQSLKLFDAKSEMDQYFMRDKFGFENIQWLTEATTGPVIFWAHNAHVLKKDLFYPNFITIGQYLAKNLKSKYVAIGSVFFEGAVRAVREAKTRVYVDIDLPEAKSSSADAFFAKQKNPQFFLNVAAAVGTKEWSEILTKETVTRNIGNTYEPEVENRNYRKANFSQQHDLVFFIKKSSIPKANQ